MTKPSGNRPATLELGRISGTVGLKGGFKFSPYHFPSTLLPQLQSVTFRHATKGESIFALTKIENRKKFQVLYVQGVGDINQAEEWVGSIVEVPIGQVRQQNLIAEDEFFWTELLGFTLFQRGEDKPLGVIKGFFPLNDRDSDSLVCVVACADSEKEMTFPWHTTFIENIDRIQRTVTLSSLTPLLVA